MRVGQNLLVLIFPIITLRGKLGRVGRRKAFWGGFRGRHYQNLQRGRRSDLKQNG